VNQLIREGRARRSTTPDRKAILAAAAELFEQQGYKNTTMQGLADHLGVAKPTLYAHADSKAKILEGIFELVVGEVDAGLEQARSLESPTEQIEAIIRNWILGSVRLRSHYIVFLSDERELPPRLVRYYRSWSAELNDVVRGIIRDGQRAGEFDVSLDVTTASFSIVAVATSTARWFNPGGRSSLEEVAATCSRLLINGLAGGEGLQNQRAFDKVR
jgi:AcrR family transcriptional regulator